jgi:hypothetical protein
MLLLLQPFFVIYKDHWELVQKVSAKRIKLAVIQYTYKVTQLHYSPPFPDKDQHVGTFYVPMPHIVLVQVPGAKGKEGGSGMEPRRRKTWQHYA